MTDQDKAPTQFPSLCFGCGKPVKAPSFYCGECAERGIGPACPGCEGLSLLDVEEEQR